MFNILSMVLRCIYKEYLCKSLGQYYNYNNSLPGSGWSVHFPFHTKTGPDYPHSPTTSFPVHIILVYASNQEFDVIIADNKIHLYAIYASSKTNYLF